MTNPSLTIQKIIKEFREKFVEINGLRIMDANNVKYIANPAEQVEKWLTDKFQEVERETYGKVLEMLKEKSGELSWCRQFNEQLVDKLSHLKSGEEKIDKIKEEFKENPNDFKKFPKIENKDWEA